MSGLDGHNSRTREAKTRHSPRGNAPRTGTTTPSARQRLLLAVHVPRRWGYARQPQQSAIDPDTTADPCRRNWKPICSIRCTEGRGVGTSCSKDDENHETRSRHERLLPGLQPRLRRIRVHPLPPLQGLTDTGLGCGNVSMLSRVIEQLRMTWDLLPDLGYGPVAVFAAFTGGNRTHRPGRLIRIDSGAEAVGHASRLPLGRGRYGIAGPTTKRAVPRLSRSSSSACRATRHTVGMRQRLGGRTQSP